MQYDDAVLAARRLAAEGRGAEDHVILAALADKIAEQDVAMAALVRESNIRHDGLLVLAENIQNQLKALRGRVGQVSTYLDSQEQELYKIKKFVNSFPKKPKKPDPEDRASD